MVLWTEPERFEVLLAERKRLVAAAAEGGRNTGVLGDPTDLIRCQDYLAKHNGTQYRQTQTTSRHSR